MTAVYIYGIIRNSGPTSFGRLGLPTGREEVEVVLQDGIAAVVSNFSGPHPKELPRHELLNQLALHQRVLERVMEEHFVLPVKFGTVLDNRAEVLKVLRCGAPQLEQAINRFDGTVQFEAAATWELGPVFADIANDEEIASLREAVGRMPQNESLSLLHTIGILVKESLDKRRNAVRGELTSLLGEYVKDRAPNALMGDEMVLNEAFLVRKSAQEEFLVRLHSADARFQGKLTLRCIGPLPPYSFGSVEVLRPSKEEIDAAAVLLGLGREFSASAVRKAYRTRAAQLHPDVNRSPEAVDAFARLRTAEALLIACCQAGGGNRELPADGNGAFQRDQTAGNYLVAVKSSN